MMKIEFIAVYLVSLILCLWFAKDTYDNDRGGENFMIVLSIIPLVNTIFMIVMCVCYFVFALINLVRKYIFKEKESNE